MERIAWRRKEEHGTRGCFSIGGAASARCDVWRVMSAIINLSAICISPCQATCAELQSQLRQKHLASVTPEVEMMRRIRLAETERDQLQQELRMAVQPFSQGMGAAVCSLFYLCALLKRHISAPQ